MSEKRERSTDFDLEKLVSQGRKLELDRSMEKLSAPEEVEARTKYKLKSTFASLAPSQTLKFNYNPSSSKAKQLVASLNKKSDKNALPDSQKQKAPFFNTGSIFGLPSGSPIFRDINSIPNFFNKYNEKKQKNLGQGLFGRKNTNAVENVSMFQNSFVQKQKEQKGSDEEGQLSAQLQKQQNLPADPKKSSGKYTYEQHCSILFNQIAKKIRNSTGGLIQNVSIILQFDPCKQSHWLIVSLTTTKKIIERGLIVKASEVRRMNEKDKNVCVSYGVFEEGKLIKRVLKIQFEQEESGRQFIEMIKSLIGKQNQNS